MAKHYSQLYGINMATAEQNMKKGNLNPREREEAEKWIERKMHYNEQGKLRQRKHQEKKRLEKEKNKDKPQKPLTRQKADKREYERNKKINQRAGYSK